MPEKQHDHLSTRVFSSACQQPFNPRFFACLQHRTATFDGALGFIIRPSPMIGLSFAIWGAIIPTNSGAYTRPVQVLIVCGRLAAKSSRRTVPSYNLRPRARKHAISPAKWATAEVGVFDVISRFRSRMDSKRARGSAR